MTDHYDDLKVAPDPVLAEALRQRLHARMANVSPDDHDGPPQHLVPMKEIDVSPDSTPSDGTKRRRIALAAAAVIVVIGAAGIAIRSGSSDDDSPPATEPTVAPTTVAQTVAPTTDVPTTENAQEITQLEILGAPDWLAADDEGVWVKLDTGELHLIDPETVTDIAEVELEEAGDQGVCQGIGVGFGSIWTCAGTDIVRVDAATRTVQSRLPLNKTSTQGHLVAHADRLWVLTGTGDTLVGLDPSTEQIVTTIALPWRASELGGGAAGLWAISTSDGHVMKVDAEAGTVLVDVAIAEPVAITVGDTVWVASMDQTVQLDPATGAVITTIDMGSGQFGSVAANSESVWVRNTTEFLVEFDARTGEQIQTQTVDVKSGGDTLLAFGSVWTTAFDDSLLVAVPID